MKNLFLLVCLFLVSTGFVKSQDSYKMNKLFQWKDSSISSTSLYNNTYNEVWGYAKDGREYAIIGSTRGTHFFDVTNPSSPIQVDFVIGRDTGVQIVHRDYHDYRGYLYMVSDEGDASLQIVDLSFLPDSVHLVYDQDTAIKLSHNIFIDTAVGKLYSCGGGNQRKFDVFSLANPLSPELLLRCENDISWWASTVGNLGYVHDAFARNDSVYCNAGTGLFVVDFSGTPTLMGAITSYPDRGYNHSGWLNESGTLYAMGDETHGKKMKILDVSDLTNIQFLDTVGVQDNVGIIHNQIIMGDYVYVAYYYNGVYVYDISNPSVPELVGFYDTSKERNFGSFRGAWGIYPFLPSGILLASDMQEGLFVLEIEKPEERQEESRFMIFPNPVISDLVIAGLSNYDEEYTLQIFDSKGAMIVDTKFYSKFLEKNIIPLPAEMHQGVYVVNIFNSTFTESIKLIKQ
jgi:choice-of-anchor B domain-containing protein